MANAMPIGKVPKDHSDRLIKAVYNPMSVDFVHKYDGEEMTLPAGQKVLFTENIAVHLAHHLAKAIVRHVAREEREALLKKADEKGKITLQMKPYPLFNYRVGDIAQMLVTEQSDDKKPSGDEIREAASEKATRSRREKEAKGAAKVAPKEQKVSFGEEKPKVAVKKTATKKK
jgi:hypothetical protein